MLKSIIGKAEVLRRQQVPARTMAVSELQSLKPLLGQRCSSVSKGERAPLTAAPRGPAVCPSEPRAADEEVNERELAPALKNLMLHRVRQASE